jgi:hypothetical protein
MGTEINENYGFLTIGMLRVPPGMEGRKTCAEDDCTRLAHGGEYCGGNICVTVISALKRFH